MKIRASYIVTIGLVFAATSGFSQVVQGVADLRDFNTEQTYMLDGAYDFY